MHHIAGTPFRYRHGWVKISEDKDKTIVSVPISDAKRFPSQGFLWRPSADIEQLTKAIKEKGFDPTRPLNMDPGIGLVDGNHRLHASERAGLTHVPVAFHKTSRSSTASQDVDTSAGYGEQSFYDRERARSREQRLEDEYLDSPEYKKKLADAERERKRRQKQWLIEAAARLRLEGNAKLAAQAEAEAKSIKLAITPGGRVGDASPLAKPGYKGKRKLSDYEREVAHALMRKGHSKKRAIAMARGIIRNAAVAGRWGRGKASGRVRAGAAASIAQRKSFSSTGGKLLDMTDPRVVAVALAVAKERGVTVDLVGPKGYVHGWKKVGLPGGHTLHEGVQHGTYTHHAVTGPDGKRVGGVTTHHSYGGVRHFVTGDHDKTNAQSFSSPKAAAKALLKRRKNMKLAMAAAVAGQLDLVGPKGYVHGWRFVGVPGGGVKVRRSRYGSGKSRMQIERVSSVTRTKGKTPNRLSEEDKKAAAYAKTVKSMGTADLLNAHARSHAANSFGSHDRQSRVLKSELVSRGVPADLVDKHAAAHVANSYGSHDEYKRQLRESALRHVSGPTKMTEDEKKAASSRHKVAVQKRGENYHVVHTVDGKSRTVAKYKDPEEAKAHAAKVGTGASALNQIREAAASDKPVVRAPKPNGTSLPARLPDSSRPYADASHEDLMAGLRNYQGNKEMVGKIRAELARRVAARNAGSSGNYPAGDRLLNASHARASETNLGAGLTVGNDKWVKGSDGIWRHQGTEGYGGYEFARATPGRRSDASGVHATPEERKKLDALFAANIDQTRALRKAEKGDYPGMTDAELRALEKFYGPGPGLDKIKAELARRHGDPAPKGTRLVKGTRYDGGEKHDVHIDGVHAGEVYKGESREPVYGKGSRVAAGYHVRKGYWARVKRDQGGMDQIGHFKTRDQAIRAVENAHRTRKGKK